VTLLDQARQRAKDGLSLTQGEALALYERNEALEVGFAVQAAVLEDKTAEVERLRRVLHALADKVALSDEVHRLPDSTAMSFTLTMGEWRAITAEGKEP